ncbi:hypothetical protein ACWECC_23245, partial [Streptomyces microflavus]
AVLPYVNSAQAAHPAYAESLRRLREMGILVGRSALPRGRPGGDAGSSGRPRGRFHGRTEADP